MLVPGQPQFYRDFTGCGNTLNCNHPVVRRFILDCLRYWVEEMHVDGFRFDLAAVFAIDVDGQQKGKTPIIREIEEDPVLSRIKLIAEPWSISQYLLGSFSDRRWAEWNGKFRDTVRRFVKGDPGVTGELASRIAGSYDLFVTPEGDRSPYHSINFVTCHDGFTLNDLVSYNQKHNERNGENNRDGTDANFSWNCGIEGPVEEANLPGGEARRRSRSFGKRQIKNFLTILFLSQGTPMLLYGDEMRRTARGNNNTVFQDNQLNWINWKEAERHHDILRFTQHIIAFRKRHQIIRRWRYLTPDESETPILRNIVWHGVKPLQADFSETSRFIAFTLEAFETRERSDVPIYVACNAFWEPMTVELPQLEGNKRWYRVVDTSLPEGEDIVPDEQAFFLGDSTYADPAPERGRADREVSAASGALSARGTLAGARLSADPRGAGSRNRPGGRTSDRSAPTASGPRPSVDPLGPAEAEMEPGVGRREVAAAAEPPGMLAATAGLQGHHGADGVAVRRAAFEAEGGEVARLGLVVEVGERADLVHDDRVEPAVVVQVADGQTAAHARRPGTAGPPRSLTSVKPARGIAEEQLRRHGIREDAG